MSHKQYGLQSMYFLHTTKPSQDVVSHSKSTNNLIHWSNGIIRIISFVFCHCIFDTHSGLYSSDSSVTTIIVLSGNANNTHDIRTSIYQTLCVSSIPYNFQWYSGEDGNPVQITRRRGQFKTTKKLYPRTRIWNIVWKTSEKKLSETTKRNKTKRILLYGVNYL